MHPENRRLPLTSLAGFLILLFFSPGVLLSDDEETNIRLVERSVVSIRVDSFNYDYGMPWNNPSVERSAGTGFIIEGNRILTNAHVVSGAVNIYVKRPDQKREFRAKLRHIAHDCDLAMLQVEEPDASAFFQGAKPLVIGDLPELSSPVVVVGFPIGGNRLSITRGVVSRIDMDTYAHSGIDSHLTIQVDAAINPGNSGGPAIQNGRVIGVAFQALRGGENLGYLIPPVVIQRFLREIEKTGAYRGYVELGVQSTSTENPVMRRALKLPSNLEDTGVLATRVLPETSAYGHIRPGDVLLEIMGHTISQSGEVLIGNRLYPYLELVDHLSEGEIIRARILRDGRMLNIEFPARRTSIFDYQRREYELPPRYYVQAGLVFQPLDANLMRRYSMEWLNQERSEIFYRYYYRFNSKAYLEREEEIVLTGRLNDTVNLYAGSFSHRLVRSVNGQKVRNFSDFVARFDRAVASEEKVIVEFEEVKRPLVLRSLDVRAANERIRKSYSLVEDRRLRTEKAR
jgi:S1-C subfamily serine protease